jgi:hypothetical protein
MKTRTAHPAAGPGKSARRTRRDGRHDARSTVRLRGRHSEVKAPKARESAPAGKGMSSDAASFLLLGLGYAGMVAFFLKLVIGS